MIFYILTLFPEMFQGYLKASILGRSIGQGSNEVHLVNIRDFALDRHKSCDDAPYGGGAGMLLKPEPVARALDMVRESARRIVYLSPSGRLLRQDLAEELAKEESLVLICGHYEGMDQRIIDLYVTDEICIGDYVLFSGEVGAMVLMDAVARLVEGVIKKESLQEESFTRQLLEYPQYTRPAEFRGSAVPEVLLSGHHEQIRLWRLRESLRKTLKMRPELLQNIALTKEEQKILKSIGKEEKRDEHHSGC